MKRTPRLAVAAAAVCAAGALASCGSSGGAGTITVYNGQHQQTTEALVAAFEKQTGIHVRERDGDESELALSIQQERGNSPADVFVTENSPALMSLEEKHLLAALPATTLAQTPRQYSSPTGDWVAVSARVSMMVYNPSKLAAGALPKSVMDLAQPQWKGKLGIAPTETDFQPIVTAIAHAYGSPAALAWLRGIKANGASHNYPDNESLVSQVNDGRVALGLINHYYWYRLQKEVGPAQTQARLAFFAARDPGYVIDVAGAGVLASSKHQAAADQFVAFLVSQAGQQVMTQSDSYEYPLRAGVAAPAGLTPFSQLQPYPVSIAELGDGALALQLLQEVQLL